MKTYECSVIQQSGFGVSWEETSRRRAFAEVRERVASGYSEDEDGTVRVDGDLIARWVNRGGKAVRVNVLQRKERGEHMICSESYLDDMQSGMKVKRCESCDQVMITGNVCDECADIMSVDFESFIRTVEATQVRCWSVESIIKYAAKFKRVSARKICKELGCDREKVGASLWRCARRRKVSTQDERTFLVFRHGNGEYTVKEVEE